MRSHFLAFLAALILLICACVPTATPLPVNLPTLPPPTLPAGSLSATAPPALRYAVAPNALPYLSDEDRSLIAASAEIVPLDAPPAADLSGYDMIALGDLPNAVRAPSPLQVSLIVNTALSPLSDNPALIDLLRRAINPAQIAAALAIPGLPASAATAANPLALRANLANAGYPDGFDLTLAAPASPAAAALAQLLAPLGIDVRLTTLVATTPNEPAHLTLTTDPTAAQATGEAVATIPLFTAPISYRAVAGLSITFTPSGFPVIQR